MQVTKHTHFALSLPLEVSAEQQRLIDALASDRVVDCGDIDEVEMTVAEEGEDPEMIDVKAQMRLQPDLEGLMIVTDTHVIAYGLCYDRDPENPMESWDGQGMIFHYGRRGSRDENSSYLEALGYDSDGNKDLRAEAVSDQLVASVCAAVRKNRSLMTTLSNLLPTKTGKRATWQEVLDKIGEAIYQEGWEYALDYVADYFFDVRWWVDLDETWQDKLDLLRTNLDEASAESAWEKAIEVGTIGNPHAVMLDIYEHGGVCYSLTGEGMQCRWDTSRGGAVWVPDACCLENVRYTVLKEAGVGAVQYFGAVGSEQNPCHARYSLDGGETWVGEGMGWSWAQAIEAMSAASGVKVEKAEHDRLMEKALRDYARGCIETYNQYINGDVYGVCVYSIDRATGERVDDEDDECWGYFGLDYAKETLVTTLLSKAECLTKPAASH